MDNAAKPVTHGRRVWWWEKEGCTPSLSLSLTGCLCFAHSRCSISLGLCVALLCYWGCIKRPAWFFAPSLLSELCSFLVQPQVPASRMPPFTLTQCKCKHYTLLWPLECIPVLSHQPGSGTLAWTKGELSLDWLKMGRASTWWSSSINTFPSRCHRSIS